MGFLQLWPVGASLHYGACASHCDVFSSCGAQAVGTQVSAAAGRGLSGCGSLALEHRLNSCGAWAWLLCSLWDPPGPGIEPVPPALAGGFFTTEPPGKPPRQGFLRKEAPLAQKGVAFGCHSEGGDIGGTD